MGYTLMQLFVPFCSLSLSTDSLPAWCSVQRDLSVWSRVPCSASFTGLFFLFARTVSPLDFSAPKREGLWPPPLLGGQGKWGPGVWAPRPPTCQVELKASGSLEMETGAQDFCPFLYYVKYLF